LGVAKAIQTFTMRGQELSLRCVKCGVTRR
jgi:hypothetical protein